MNSTRRTTFLLSVSALVVASLLTASLQATVIVDDSFADGDFDKTGPLDTPWWTSSSSSGKEISPGSLGLVTGSSGRGIHTIFPTQKLSNVGDTLKVTYAFTTPATVGVNRSTAFRVGLFDNLGKTGPATDDPNTTTLNADVGASSSSPNPIFGWGLADSGPGSQPLPGYMFDMDVNLTDASDDLNFREHAQEPAGIVGSGRLMSTTTYFDNISPSGPDEGYTFTPDTAYTGMFQITRINATDFRLTGMLNGISYTNTDTFDSDMFGMLGFHANSNTFGSSNAVGEADNGIDFSNIKIEFLVPEPSTIALLIGALIAMPSLGRRK